MNRILALAFLLALTSGFANAQTSRSLAKSRIDSLNDRAQWFRGTRPDSTIRIAERALDEAGKVGYPKGRAVALRWIALARTLTGQQGALPLLEESETILAQIGDQAEQAATWIATGTVYFYQGAYEFAGERWHKALSTYEQLGDSVGITNVWNNLGNLHRALGQNELALKYARQSLEFRERGTDTLLIAGSLNNVANLLSELQRYDEAIKAHERGLALNLAIGNSRSVGNSYMNLGSVHLRRGSPELALDYYRKAADIRISMNDTRSLSVVYSGMADAFIVLGRYGEAARIAEEAYGLARRVSSPREANDASRFAYTAFKNAGDAEAALRYLEVHKQLSDSLLSVDRQKAIANLESVAELTRVQENLSRVETRSRYTRIIAIIVTISLVCAIVALIIIRRSHKREQRLSEELRRLGEQKDRMFSILSHDLRSPLNSLYSLVQLMDMDALAPNEWRSLKTTLLRQFQNTDDTLRDILLWATGQLEGSAPRVQPVNLSEAVSSTVELLEVIAAPKSISIDVDVEADAMVLTDRAHLSAVIRNLLTNAIKFSPEGKPIRVRSRRDGTSHHLIIIDEGVGMSQDKVKALFTNAIVHTSGTSGEPGSGLGLIIVRDLVRRNQGTIEVTSQIGTGTQFDVGFPAA